MDLSGKSILDIGCGSGGPSIVLAGETGAVQIIAVDVQSALLQQAVDFAKKAGVADKITFRLVQPGPLPFDDNTFDVVFSKDALIHFTDKEAIYREILRVLRPKGEIVASDWLGGENTASLPEWARFMKLSQHEFTMAAAAETQATMTAAGFTNVSARDRSHWYAELSRHEITQIEGPLRRQIIDAAGEEIYSAWVEVRRANLASVAVGALRPTHLRGIKPAA